MHLERQSLKSIIIIIIIIIIMIFFHIILHLKFPFMISFIYL